MNNKSTASTQQFKQMLNALKAKPTNLGGVKALVQMLKTMDRESEKHILQSLKNSNPKLHAEICNAYFTFEDVTTMNDELLKRALSEIHRSTLALALKGTPDALRQKIFRNLSPRAAQLLKDDMDLMGPKPRHVVEAAQREVTNTLQDWKDVIL